MLLERRNPIPIFRCIIPQAPVSCVMNLKVALSIYPYKLMDKKIKVGKKGVGGLCQWYFGYLYFGRIDFVLKRKYKEGSSSFPVGNSSRLPPVTCFSLRDRDIFVHHQPWTGSLWNMTQSLSKLHPTVPPFLLLISAKAIMREALSYVLSTEHWQLWPKLICQLFPNRNQSKSYWLRKQTILIESRVTGGSQMLLHPRITGELLKLLMLRHTIPFKHVTLGMTWALVFLKIYPVIGMCCPVWEAVALPGPSADYPRAPSAVGH